MGAVYLAHQPSLDREVALKILSREMAARGNFVERFYREARSMARLNHPNIVSCYAVGEDKGYHYLAMELIDGKSMQYWLDKLGKLSVADALHVGLRAAAALQFAHENGLIHRDIKPDNMLVTTKGVLKVSDMGLAKNVDEAMSMTQSGMGLGTPYYMPPEQARNAKHCDHRSDVYALGCTLYHLLSGALPFKGDNTLELIVNKEKGQFPPLRKLNPQVPERLDLVISKTIQKDPAHRHQSCADLIHDLESCARPSAALSFISGANSTASAAAPSTPHPPVGHAAAPTNATPTSAASTSAGVTKVAAAPAAPPVSNPPAAETARGRGDFTGGGTGATETPLPADEWYVRYAAPDGRVKTARLKQERILQLLKTHQIDNRAQVSKKLSGEFRVIGAVPYFDKAVRSQIIQKEVATKGAKREDEMKRLYRAAERQQRWGGTIRLFKNAFSNVTGFIGLVVYLAIVAAVLGGGAFAAYKYGLPAIQNYMDKSSPRDPVKQAEAADAAV
jgi:serine/threonine-protein kinase